MLDRYKQFAHWRGQMESRFWQPARMARHHGRDLKSVHDRTARIGPGDILSFSTIRNEMLRLPFFLDYYRGQGVAHFLFVDNDSDDGLLDYLGEQPDCSVWHTKASYKESLFGVHWLNYLLHRYGCGHWCLTLDPDEFLVFPYCEERPLHDLISFLKDEDLDHFFCVMLDMYSDRPVTETVCAVGQNPVEVAPFFDATGYVQKPDASYGETFIQGGPRRRVFFKDMPERAPALNKTPLIKWQNDTNYLSSTHMAAPKRLNRPHPRDRFAPSGCLLHFKFLSVMMEKVTEEIDRKQHYDDSIEYRRYKAAIENEGDILFHSDSVRFENSRQLEKLGMMSFGRWF